MGYTQLEATPDQEPNHERAVLTVGEEALRTKSRFASLATLIKVATRVGYTMPDRLPNAAKICSCARERHGRIVGRSVQAKALLGDITGASTFENGPTGHPSAALSVDTGCSH